MKVGIVTFHAAHNYGAMLQAYGLQKTLERLGHESIIVHIFTKRMENKNLRRLTGISLRAIALKIITTLLGAYFKRRYDRFELFMKTNMKLSRRYSTCEELVASPPLCDAFICGSDQVWNVENGIGAYFFLQFAPAGARKIAYAPSFGSDKIPDEYKPKISSYLSSFNAISVRESSGIEIVNELIGKQVPQVLDPVFLLDKNQWLSIAKKPKFNEPYIAFYSLEMTPLMEAMVVLLSKKLRMPVVILGKSGLLPFKCKTKIAIDSGPQEVLGWLYNATVICTNSFHATVFSLVFEKPFFVVPHSTRNTRLVSLIEIAQLNQRIVTDLEVLRESPKESLLEINYSSWRLAFSKEYEKSISFLQMSLAN
jgi:hypothetical protein